MKCIRPKLGVQGGSKKQRAQPVSNSEMGTLDGAILMGGVSTGGADFVVVFCKQFLDFRMVVEFTALIKEDILVGTSRAVVFEEVSQPSHRSSFGDSGVTMEAACVMIGNQDPSGFTIEANKFSLALLVSGAGAGEGEVDGEALVCPGGCLGCVRTSRLLGHLSLDADWAFIKDGISSRELGDTLDGVVGIVQVIITGMPKALVPEKSFRLCLEGMDGGGLVDEVVPGDLRELRRHGCQLGQEGGVLFHLMLMDSLVMCRGASCIERWIGSPQGMNGPFLEGGGVAGSGQRTSSIKVRWNDGLGVAVATG